MACRFRLWGGHNNDERLSLGFSKFDAWRRAEKKSTSLTKFELKTFKMKSLLG